jgi:hypothetical protein
MLVERSLEQKRRDAFMRIAKNMAGTSLAAAVPTPVLEAPKMIGIAVADAWMFWDIYKIYYDDTLTTRKLQEMLGTAGIIVFTGGAVSYSMLRVSQSALNEFLNAVPLIGWAIAGTMTGASTLTIGLAWTIYIESQFRVEHNVPLPRTDETSTTTTKKKRVEISGGDDEPEPTYIAEQVSASMNGTAAHIESDVPMQPVAPAIEGVEPDDEGRIMTLHPEGKQGTHIDFDQYLTIREAIVRILGDQGEMTLKDLTSRIEDEVGPDFDGSVRWYVMTVKLDLEAREIVERVPDETPQRVRLIS